MSGGKEGGQGGGEVAALGGQEAVIVEDCLGYLSL